MKTSFVSPSPCCNVPSHATSGACDDESTVSPALRFLLVAYVGAQWRLEWELNTPRWHTGAAALRLVLDRLAETSSNPLPVTHEVHICAQPGQVSPFRCAEGRSRA